MTFQLTFHLKRKKKQKTPHLLLACLKGFCLCNLEQAGSYHREPRTAEPAHADIMYKAIKALFAAGQLLSRLKNRSDNAAFGQSWHTMPLQCKIHVMLMVALGTAS